MGQDGDNRRLVVRVRSRCDSEKHCRPTLVPGLSPVVGFLLLRRFISSQFRKVDDLTQFKVGGMALFILFFAPSSLLFICGPVMEPHSHSTSHCPFPSFANLPLEQK